MNYDNKMPKTENETKVETIHKPYTNRKLRKKRQNSNYRVSFKTVTLNFTNAGKLVGINYFPFTWTCFEFPEILHSCLGVEFKNNYKI